MSPEVGRPLLAAAHGTRDPAGVAAVQATVALAARRRPGLLARAGFVDDASPSVRDALRALAGQRPVVVPFLLTAASHSKGDIPAVVAELRQAGHEVAYGRPLGPHPQLLEAVGELLAEAGVGPAAPVVLAAAGAADPAANAEIVATARLLSEARGLAPVEAAFASATRPGVAEAVARLVRLGASAGEIAVVPYFLSPGHFSRLVTAQARSARVGTVTGVLGPRPRIADLLLARYDEAQGRDLRMNCDLCIYRGAVAGRADAVGAPQLPHPHPDDAPGPPPG